MAAITIAEAITLALARAMRDDPNVLVLGEDIGKNGGVFRVTQGLYDEFGPERVIDTPLAESMIAGVSIGMAAQGLRPVAEFQFEGFIYPAVDQIINHAARLRNRTRGRLSCPLVFRVPYGGGIHAPEHHSDSPEAIFAHTPGLRVVIPSSPARAYGLMLASIFNNDPVIFFEPKRIYRSIKQEVLDDGKALPLDRAFILREGEHLTLISWGACIKETLAAAEQLALEGIEAEVIDVATIKPLDMGRILQSVEKTGRVVIVQEAPRTCGVGAEIAGTIAEEALLSLQAPIRRVTGYDTVMPYYKLENYYLPVVEQILSAARETVAFA